ncbi:hypothetical protein GCM10020256_11460 [Streptomyces thermocoprophilus]
MVLAVEVDGLAALVEVGADRDGGVAVVGVGVNQEVAVADVVVDLLRLVGDLADLVAGAPGHWVVRPGPFLVDGLLEARGDLDGDAFGGQVLGGVGGPVGLLVIDAGQDQDACGGGTPAGSLQSRGGDAGLGAGQDGLHGARVSGVGVEADMGVDGGSHVGGSHPFCRWPDPRARPPA